MSDFRSMGVFSLVQLNYFTKTYRVEAQRYGCVVNVLAEELTPVLLIAFGFYAVLTVP